MNKDTVLETTIGLTIAKKARAATKKMRESSCDIRNQVLQLASENLHNCRDKISEANKKDVDGAIARNENNPFIDRLVIKPEKIDRMIENIKSVIALYDPIMKLGEMRTQPSGIKVGKMQVPIGVIAIVYESRPSVTAECSSLGIKSGNVMILRGGSEAIHSNSVIAECFTQALQKYNLPSTAIQLVQNTDRAIVSQLLVEDSYIDLVIPRGGKSLISKVREISKIPTLDHLDGICHIYVDKDANQASALEICDNAKTQSLSMCNTVETILIHKDIAKEFIPKLFQLYRGKAVEIRGCEHSCEIDKSILQATEEDWATEYLDAIISVKVVDSVNAAIDHIDTYGSGHTDTIISENQGAIDIFLLAVDSSSVMVNTSTRFADGFEYGLGAEIGISTSRLHARGPVGLEGLTISKFIVVSDGAIRK